MTAQSIASLAGTAGHPQRSALSPLCLLQLCLKLFSLPQPPWTSDTPSERQQPQLFEKREGAVSLGLTGMASRRQKQASAYGWLVVAGRVLRRVYRLLTFQSRYVHYRKQRHWPGCPCNERGYTDPSSVTSSCSVTPPLQCYLTATTQ